MDLCYMDLCCLIQIKCMYVCMYKINKAYTCWLGLIKHKFKHVTIPTFVLLYKSMVRSHLDYCCSVWTPYRKANIEALEKVHEKATKTLSALKNLKYKDGCS